MNLDELKSYLRLDGTDEDELIQSLKLAAEEYMTNAGVDQNYTKELYKLAIKLLVSHWYENRSPVVIGTITKSIEFALSNIITQLKYCYGGDA